MSHQRTIFWVGERSGSDRALAELLPFGIQLRFFGSVGEFVAAAHHLRRECVLVDMDSIDPGQAEALAELGSLWPIVALSGRRDFRTSFEAGRMGAIDLIAKPPSIPELIRALAHASLHLLQGLAEEGCPTPSGTPTRKRRSLS